jgi:hypothetical protein
VTDTQREPSPAMQQLIEAGLRAGFKQPVTRDFER